MGYLLVGIGGLLGSIARFSLGRFIGRNSTARFPIGTFIINIAGAFLLGIASSKALSRGTYLLFADGFLGAFTTFSTFMYEGFDLLHNRKRLNAAVYIVLSLLLGVIGFFAGSIL